MKVEVSRTAQISLEEIIDFLKINWTKKEINTLKVDIKNFRQVIKDGIIQHQSLENYTNIRFTLIGKKQVKLFYEIKKDLVIIKLFWHCKQNPNKLMTILNQK